MIEILTRFAANPAVSGVLFAVGLAALGLWLAAAWWTYLDISRRSDSELARLLAPSWVVISTPLLLPLALGVYTLLRPQQTVGDRRTRSLVTALGPELAHVDSCPGCGERADDAWRRCPSCTTWLQAPCAHCGGWSNVQLELCPWCGSDVLDIPRVAEPSELGAVALAAAGGRPSVVAVTAVTAVSVAADPAGAHLSAVRGAASALADHAAGAIADAAGPDGSIDAPTIATVEQPSGDEAEVVDASSAGDQRRWRGARLLRPRTVSASARRTSEAPGPRRVRRSGSGEGTGGRTPSRAKQ